eukprot:evm.model.scf_376EXC.4 EVM.evm.TU.scf_376EXC.4   scf_376EXC:47432-49270(-)
MVYISRDGDVRSRRFWKPIQAVVDFISMVYEVLWTFFSTLVSPDATDAYLKRGRNANDRFRGGGGGGSGGYPGGGPGGGGGPRRRMDMGSMRAARGAGKEQGHPDECLSPLPKFHISNPLHALGSAHYAWGCLLCVWWHRDPTGT